MALLRGGRGGGTYRPLHTTGASTNGGRLFWDEGPEMIANFNSRPRMGGDSKFTQNKLAVYMQNSEIKSLIFLENSLMHKRDKQHYTVSYNSHKHRFRIAAPTCRKFLCCAGQRRRGLQEQRFPGLYWTGPAHGNDSGLIMVPKPVEAHRILVVVDYSGEI